MNEITLSIIIVNYKSWIPLEKCIHNINNQIDINPEIIVVDNNSGDDFIHLFKKKFPKVLWIENKSNSGFSKGCNIGAEKASNKTTRRSININFSIIWCKIIGCILRCNS